MKRASKFISFCCMEILYCNFMYQSTDHLARREKTIILYKSKMEHETEFQYNSDHYLIESRFSVLFIPSDINKKIA